MTARPLPRFARARTSDAPADRFDYALLARLLSGGRACDCRCRATDHDDRGCHWCGPGRCAVTYEQHPDREEAQHLEDWMTRELAAGGELARWIDGWRLADPPADQRRPADVAGEIGGTASGAPERRIG
jgi:hypothetical protein